MEFRNSIDTTGVNIPARIVDYVLAVGSASRDQRAGQTAKWEWTPDGIAIGMPAVAAGRDA